MVLLLVLLLPASFFGIYYVDKKKGRSAQHEIRKKLAVPASGADVEMHNVEMLDAYDKANKRRGRLLPKGGLADSELPRVESMSLRGLA